MVRVFCFVGALVVLASCALSAEDDGHPWDLPTCQKCLPRQQIVAPGVAFDLTDSYGVAAVRLHNGSMIDVGRVEAVREYVDYIQRGLHRREGDRLSETIRQARRRLNKALGRPGSPEASILISLITPLREKVESALGHTIDSVLLTAPTRTLDLADEELADALEYLGLAPVRQDNVLGLAVSAHPDHFNAAYAGYGHSLCSRDNYTDTDSCLYEVVRHPDEYVLVIEFSQSVLAAEAALCRWFGCMSGSPDTYYDLGLPRPPPEGLDAEWYWLAVKQAIVTAIKEGMGGIGRVLLLGDSALEEQFLGTVRDALEEAGQHRVQMSYHVDPEWMAVRGAAEVAKRALESPPGCVETEECRRRRTEEEWEEELRNWAEERAREGWRGSSSGGGSLRVQDYR